MGTGGTVTGAGHFLKEKNSEIKVVSICVCLCVCVFVRERSKCSSVLIFLVGFHLFTFRFMG